MHDQLSSTSATSSSVSLRNFIHTCKSPETRSTYTKFVNRFMNYLQIRHGEYDKLVEKDPEIIQIDICGYITFLRQGHASPAAISLKVAALTKFYTMNDMLSLNWKKIKSFEPEKEKVLQRYKKRDNHGIPPTSLIKSLATLCLNRTFWIFIMRS
jgi:hypothetical protein